MASASPFSRHLMEPLIFVERVNKEIAKSLSLSHDSLRQERDIQIMKTQMTVFHMDLRNTGQYKTTEVFVCLLFLAEMW